MIKSVKCGECNHDVVVPEDKDRGHGFALHLVECDKCGATAGGGNGGTGEITTWMSARSRSRALAEIHAQECDAFNNEFYGRGNW
jgi:ribosomal protein S27E